MAQKARRDWPGEPLCHTLRHSFATQRLKSGWGLWAVQERLDRKEVETTMYGIPKNLDLSCTVGESLTQVLVGQFDLQFDFGPVRFAVQSPVDLYRDGKLLAHWEEGRWPDSGFYDIMNTDVQRCEVVNDRLIVIEFKNGITMRLADSSDQYESMQIRFQGDPTLWVI